MKEKYTYRTSDLNLASFLLAKGLVFLNIEPVNDDRYNLVFEIPESINMITIQKEWFSVHGEFYRLLFNKKRFLTKSITNFKNKVDNLF